jgi:hypothetical protein
MFPAAREAVVRLTEAEADPLAVLPVTAATASAAFARAADPGRDHLERQQQLAVLETSLDSVVRLLDRCRQEAARLAGALAEECRVVDACPVRGRCAGTVPACRCRAQPGSGAASAAAESPLCHPAVPAACNRPM